MKKRKMSRAGLLMAIVVIVAACGGSESGGDTVEVTSTSSAPATEPLVLEIGMSAALSGWGASFDAPFVNGMNFAIDEINASGNPDGVTVKIDVKDNQSDQTIAASTQQELIDAGYGVFVITATDAVTAQGIMVADAGGISNIGINTAPAIVADVGPTAFSHIFGDNHQASAGAQYACDQGYGTVYLLGSTEIPYTKDPPQFFADAFENICGGEVVGENDYKLGATEFGTQVTKIQNADPAPDVIFTPMYVPDSGAFLKQLRAAGVDVPVISMDGNDSTLFADSGGAAVDGVVFTTHAFPSPGSAYEQFVNDYEAATGAPPESTFEAIGRDFVYLMVEAVKEAGSIDPDKLLSTILSLTDVPLVTGDLTMDPETRFPVKGIALVKMEGTERTLFDVIVPSYVAPFNG